MSLIALSPYQLYRTWTPARITTALWLDAADVSTLTLNSGAVSEWRDKSGNARHASQSTALNRPLYSATGFNGLPTIQFDGSNDQLDLVQFAQVSGQNIFAVIDTTNIGTTYRILLHRSSAVATNLALYLGGDTASRRPLVYWGADRSVWGSSIQSKALFRWSFSAGTPASALTQVDAGTPVTSTFSASALTNWSSICLSAVQQSDIDLSELIITPDSSEVDRIFGYLAHKWGLTANLPAGHPFKTTPP